MIYLQLNMMEIGSVDYKLNMLPNFTEYFSKQLLNKLLIELKSSVKEIELKIKELSI